MRGCEIWTLKQRDIRNLQEAEMKSMENKARYVLLDYKGSGNILELNLHPVKNKLAQYKNG